MRKDRLSSYQAKKEKLQRIKNILYKEYKTYGYSYLELDLKAGRNFLDNIWEIVKNE